MQSANKTMERVLWGSRFSRVYGSAGGTGSVCSAFEYFRYNLVQFQDVIIAIIGVHFNEKDFEQYYIIQ